METETRAERQCKCLRAALTQAAHPIVITGHDRADVDSVVSCILMAHLLDVWEIPCRIALHEPDKQSRRVMARFGIDVSQMEGETHDGDSLLLVDHHRATRPGNVVACVDHHATDYPPDYACTLIYACGACVLMVQHLMGMAYMRISQQDMQLAVTALYLDTIALRSSKVKPLEAIWGRSWARKLGMDIAWLEREGMGLRDMNAPAEELAMLGRKAFDYGGRRVLSTYVQTDEMAQGKLGEILAVLRTQLAREGAALWVFLHHNPVGGRTTEYDLYPDGRMEMIRYDFLASRGKDVMPRVERAMREEAGV